MTPIDSQVVVLLGPNGSGKSLLLRNEAIRRSDTFDSVIGVSPTIYDRFERLRKPAFHLFTARHGRAGVSRVLRDALRRVSGENLSLLKKISMSLSYVGFDPFIGIRLKAFNPSWSHTFEHDLPSEQLEELEWLTRKWNSISDGDMVWLGLDDFSFSEIERSQFSRIAELDESIRKVGMAGKVQYLLRKGGQALLPFEASSGEITFVATIVHIATNLKGRGSILIDEPETSLHPTWQKDYIKFLLDIFHYEQPNILIATHSPLLVSGGEVFADGMTVKRYNRETKMFEDFQPTKQSLERMLYDFFGLITPKNHFLSEIAIDLLNDLSNGDSTLDSINRSLDEISDSCFDHEQRDLLNDVKRAAVQIHQRRKGTQTDG
ncbi:MAG: hypothetical protein C0452_18425 [Pseudomonas sp.]|nr:hypothetical protein [Pseudomonas sp.]